MIPSPSCCHRIRRVPTEAAEMNSSEPECLVIRERKLDSASHGQTMGALHRVRDANSAVVLSSRRVCVRGNSRGRREVLCHHPQAVRRALARGGESGRVRRNAGGGRLAADMFAETGRFPDSARPHLPCLPLCIPIPASSYG